jgi:DnaJ-class molecular chaperone
MSDDWEYDDDACPNCGAQPTAYRECSHCVGNGWVGDLDEIDPLWYDEDDTEPCGECHGQGAFKWCRECGYDFFEKKVIAS